MVHQRTFEVWKYRLFCSQLQTSFSHLPPCYCYCAARGQLLLTQTDVVVEGSEEVVALFPVVAARRARAPGSHVGCGVVKVVGSYCASCREEERGKQHSSVRLQTDWRNTTSHTTGWDHTRSRAVFYLLNWTEYQTFLLSFIIQDVLPAVLCHFELFFYKHLIKSPVCLTEEFNVPTNWTFEQNLADLILLCLAWLWPYPDYDNQIKAFTWQFLSSQRCYNQVKSVSARECVHCERNWQEFKKRNRWKWSE